MPEPLRQQEAFDASPSTSSNSSSSFSSNDRRTRKPRFVPWEPFKGAVSEEKTGDKEPPSLPLLVPYRLPGEQDEENNNYKFEFDKQVPLVDARRARETEGGGREVAKENEEMVKLREELNVEREVNAELKRLLMAAVSEDLQSAVVALSEDKVRLANSLDKYARKSVSEEEEAATLLIERDVFKCKFLAMSVRVDELHTKEERLLSLLRSSQRLLHDLLLTAGLLHDGNAPSLSGIPRALLSQSRRFASFDLQSLYSRSPCEPRVRPPQPNFSNLTIACCPRCAGREIQLL